VRRISETLSYGLEDMARAVVPGWLHRHEGIDVEDLVRKFFTVRARTHISPLPGWRGRGPPSLPPASPTAALQSVMGRPPPAASPSPPPLQPRALGPPPCGGPPDGGLEYSPPEAAFPQGNGLRRCARGFINSTLRSPKVIFSKLKVKEKNREYSSSYRERARRTR
jgi:hypothetical protein